MTSIGGIYRYEYRTTIIDYKPCSLSTLSLSRSSPQEVVDLISSSLLLKTPVLPWPEETCGLPLPLFFTLRCLWGLGGGGRTQSDGSEDSESVCIIAISRLDLQQSHAFSCLVERHTHNYTIKINTILLYVLQIKVNIFMAKVLKSAKQASGYTVFNRHSQ